MPSSFNYEISEIQNILFRISSSLSLLCSLLTLFIMYKLNKPMNVFRSLIIGLTVSQTIYDIKLIIDSNVSTFISSFLNLLSWTSATLLSNIMASLILYTYISKSSITLMYNHKYYVMMAIIPSLINAFLLFYFNSNPNIDINIFIEYQIIFKAVSILYDLIILLILQYCIKFDVSSSKVILRVFTYRLKFYIFILVLARLFSTWYEVIVFLFLMNCFFY